MTTDTPHEHDEEDRLRRRVLWSMPSGLYVVGSRAGHQRNLMTLSWASQVATEPKLVGIGVETAAVTHRLISQGAVFTLALLAREDRALVRKFVKPVADVHVDEGSGGGTMNDVAVFAARTGAPIPSQAAAWVDCELRHALALGSHTWFVGEIVAAGISASATTSSGPVEVLRMEDTRMNYGG